MKNFIKDTIINQNYDKIKTPNVTIEIFAKHIIQERCDHDHFFSIFEETNNQSINQILC